MGEKSEIKYLISCIPEKMEIKDLVEYQARKKNLYFLWSAKYLFEYVEKWTHEEPYLHYIIMVNYTDLEEYKRYVVLDKDELFFSHNLRNLKGSTLPVLIKKAEKEHPRTQAILRQINAKVTSTISSN